MPDEILALIPSDHEAFRWDWPITAVTADYIETLQAKVAAAETREHLQPILNRLSTVEMTPAGVSVAPDLVMTRARDFYCWLMGITP